MTTRDVCKMVLEHHRTLDDNSPTGAVCAGCCLQVEPTEGAAGSCGSPPDKCFVVAAKMALEQPDVEELLRSAATRPDGEVFDVTVHPYPDGWWVNDGEACSARGATLTEALQRLLAQQEAK